MKLKTTTVFFMVILFPVFSGTSFSQQLFKIYDEIGGGGTTTTVTEESDNTMLYVVGGAVIAGIVIYALLKDKKETPKTDSTKAILKNDFLEKQLTLNDRIQKYRSQIPINISFGMQNDFLRKEDKRYFVGLAYNF
jgi:hypothetical protein